MILELQEDAHKIRGVALTLGFDGLGRVAAQVDELLNPWLRSDQALPVGADHIAAFGDLLAAIDAALTSRP